MVNVLDLLYGLVITLVLGSYLFTWRMCSAIWKAIEKIWSNDLKHIEARLDKLEMK